MPPDITTLLQALAAGKGGDKQAESRLLSAVYTQLQHLAAGLLAQEKKDISLERTDLVHNAYLKLNPAHLSLENRRHFFGSAARAMRQLLIDAARARSAEKRANTEPLTAPNNLASPEKDQRLLALDEALTRLQSHDPLAAQIVELHHFANLPHDQVAALLSTTLYEVRSKWTFARAYLKSALD